MKLFITGGQGSGKTRIGKALADATGLTLIDAWNGLATLPVDCIVTTQLRRYQMYQFPDALFVEASRA